MFKGYHLTFLYLRVFRSTSVYLHSMETSLLDVRMSVV